MGAQDHLVYDGRTERMSLLVLAQVMPVLEALAAARALVSRCDAALQSKMPRQVALVGVTTTTAQAPKWQCTLVTVPLRVGRRRERPVKPFWRAEENLALANMNGQTTEITISGRGASVVLCKL